MFFFFFFNIVCKRSLSCLCYFQLAVMSARGIIYLFNKMVVNVHANSKLCRLQLIDFLMKMKSLWSHICDIFCLLQMLLPRQQPNRLERLQPRRKQLCRQNSPLVVKWYHPLKMNLQPKVNSCNFIKHFIGWRKLGWEMGRKNCMDLLCRIYEWRKN